MKYFDRHKEALLNCVLANFKLFSNAQNCLSRFADLIEAVNDLKELKAISITLLTELDDHIRICSNKLEIYNFITKFSYLLNRITPFEYYYELLLAHVTKKCEDENYTWYKQACELRELISNSDQHKKLGALKKEVEFFCSTRLNGWIFSSKELQGDLNLILSKIDFDHEDYNQINEKYQLQPLEAYLSLPAPIPSPLPSPMLSLYSTSCPSTIEYNDSQSNLECELKKINLKKSMN
jgi:hypothetical protein